MILGYGTHTKTDWWSFGILIYELMYGDFPFGNKDEKAVLKRIDSDELTFDDLYMEVSDEAKDLISKVSLTQRICLMGRFAGLVAGKGFEEQVGELARGYEAPVL